MDHKLSNAYLVRMNCDRRITAHIPVADQQIEPARLPVRGESLILVAFVPRAELPFHNLAICQVVNNPCELLICVCCWSRRDVHDSSQPSTSATGAANRLAIASARDVPEHVPHHPIKHSCHESAAGSILNPAGVRRSFFAAWGSGEGRIKVGTRVGPEWTARAGVVRYDRRFAADALRGGHEARRLRSRDGPPPFAAAHGQAVLPVCAGFLHS